MGSEPPASSSLPVGSVSEPPTKRKREDGGDKNKNKVAVVKVARKAHPDGSSNSSGDDLGADPFSNPNIIWNLTYKFALPEEVDHLANLDRMHFVWEFLETFLKEKVVEVERPAEKKVAKNENIWRVLQKEELVSIGIKTALALEEEKKEAKIKVDELEVKMSKSILMAAARAMEEFKASSKIKDLNIAFSQKAFIKGFELYESRMARKFSKLDLNFLEEEPDEEMGPSNAVTNPSPTEVVFESSELAIEVLEPM
ncbi:hypothetical protein COCNU_scaffold006570G000010 [Cocos nucifera]|nr:hypothetical protein [Cocos nucifera]